MRTLGLALLSVLAACGYKFDKLPPPDDPAPDAPPDSPPPPPDALTVLPCSPVRFSISDTTAFVTAVGTRQGYDVFAVDDTGAVRGYAYQFVNDKLEQVAGTGNVLPVPLSIGPVAAVALDPDPSDNVDVVIAVPYPAPAATSLNTTTPLGTVVIPFDAQLQRVDTPEMATLNDGLVAGPGALAGGDHGTVAFVGRDGGGSLALQSVSRRGVNVPAGRYPVDTNDHAVTRPTLLRAATGYLAVWSDNMALPHEAIVAAVVDDNLVAHAPLTISVNDLHGSFVPTATYLPGAHRYLFAWFEKPGKDFIHLSLRDEQLANAPGEIISFVQEGNLPIIAAGTDDFLVVWPDTRNTPTQRLGAARVAADGSFLLPGIISTGGDAVAFDVVVHNGQPALFWVEKNGLGPNLWMDALCL